MLKVVKIVILSCVVFLGSTQFTHADTSPKAAELYQRHCMSCHLLSDDGPPALGPALSDIVGKPAGEIEGYVYSPALLEKAATGLIWDSPTLDRFLRSPAELVPGTKMGFPGLSSADDRQKLIQWLAGTELISAASEKIQTVTTDNPDIERILALDADPDYGEYLASECVTCHSGGGAGGAVPTINGLPPGYFLQAMLAYKNKQRENSVMRLMAGNLGDDELAALAAFFARQ